MEFVLNVAWQRIRGRGGVSFPRSPSMNIMDLVDAIAPDCEVKFTGVRPGEKIHELLVSS